MSRVPRLLTVCLIAATAVLVPQTAAMAETCGPNPAICYAIARWIVGAPSGFEGASLALRTNCMISEHPELDHGIVTNELWVATDIPDVYGVQRWTEVGITVGKFQGVSGGISTPSWYWADMRTGYPSGNYHEHLVGAANLGSYTTVSIVERGIGTGDWDVTIGNFYGASSVGNFNGPSDWLQTGTESHGDFSQSYGSSKNLTYYNLSGDPVSDWISTLNPTSHAVLVPPDPNLHSNWVTTNSWMQDGEGATC